MLGTPALLDVLAELAEPHADQQAADGGDAHVARWMDVVTVAVDVDGQCLRGFVGVGEDGGAVYRLIRAPRELQIEAHSGRDTLEDDLGVRCWRQVVRWTLVIDMRVVPPGRDAKQDAIAVRLDHRDGYSVVLLFPYVIGAGGEVTLEAPFAVKGEQRIFAR